MTRLRNHITQRYSEAGGFRKEGGRSRMSIMPGGGCMAVSPAWNHMLPILISVFMVTAVTSCAVFEQNTKSEIPLSVRERLEQQQNENTAETVQLEDERLFIDEELQRRAEESVARYEELREEYRTLANRAITLYTEAHAAYVNGDYVRALELLQDETEQLGYADLLALKGSVLNALQEEERAVTFWERAVALNDAVVNDMLPDMRQWYEEVHSP